MRKILGKRHEDVKTFVQTINGELERIVELIARNEKMNKREGLWKNQYPR
jgi:hypothetical protein